MTVLLDTLIGSRLYGTHHNNSDTDRLRVVMPTKRQIVLGQGVFSSHDPTHLLGDCQVHSLARFAALLHSAEIPVVDAFFAPSAVREEHPRFAELRVDLCALMPPDLPGMLSFCRSHFLRPEQQMRNREAIAALRDLMASTRSMDAVFSTIDPLIAQFPEVLRRHLIPSSNGSVEHLSVVDRNYARTMPLKEFDAALASLLRRQGTQTLEDLVRARRITPKSLARAVRVGFQAVEFLQTHTITFPSPILTALLDIQSGQTDLAAGMDMARAYYEQAREIGRHRPMVAPSLVDDVVVKAYGAEVVR